MAFPSKWVEPSGGLKENRAGSSQKGPRHPAFFSGMILWAEKFTLLLPGLLKGGIPLDFPWKHEGCFVPEFPWQSDPQKSVLRYPSLAIHYVGGHSCSSTRLHAGEEEGFPVSSYKPAAAPSGWWRCSITVGTVVYEPRMRFGHSWVLWVMSWWTNSLPSVQLVRQRRDCVHVVPECWPQLLQWTSPPCKHCCWRPRWSQTVTGCVDEQGEFFRYPRVPFDFSITSGVIKWDPFEGKQTIQIYGKFEGFPILKNNLWYWGSQGWCIFLLLDEELKNPRILKITG